MKNSEEIEKSNELVSLEYHVTELSSKKFWVNKTFTRILKKVFEPATDTIQNTSEDLTKTITLTSKKNNKTVENLIDKLLKIVNDRGILASYLASPLYKINKPEYTSQFKLVKDPSSNRVNGLWIDKTIPVTLHKNLLTYRDTDKKTKKQRNLLKMIINKNYKVDLANLLDKK